MKKTNLFGMPVVSGVQPYPEGPFPSDDREYFIITYETDIELLKEIAPKPLEVVSPYVKFEFIRMPSYGLGDFCESGQVIEVKLNDEVGNYIHRMYLDGATSVAAGREVWGFPKMMASPRLYIDQDALVGTLDYGTLRVAQASMGLKQKRVPLDKVKEAAEQPTFVLKSIPHVDGTPRVCELVKFNLSNVNVKGAWSGSSALDLFQHALIPVADLPIKRIISAVHFIADVTVDYGEVVHDYLSK
ncbi:acetoacetate decarboxylase [Dongshaea marina]|uniref:acetoacetate decarboxylase n=1 Tax=Dongshaea marina TaxID=2047966 RepID=UPI000D3E1C50|nr:acetoacetate decarboxylase [Dongshaea marina]